MIETRSGTGATAQTSFWALAVLLISVGVGLVQEGGDNQIVVGAILVVCGIVLVFAKYYLKLPDVSEQEMMDTIMAFENSYERVIKSLVDTYEGDVHKARDEIIAHRRVIEATASLLPMKYRDALMALLDALDHKNGL